MDLQFGICGGPELADLAAKTGFDYIEWSVGGLLAPGEEDAVFHRQLAALEATVFPCPVLNCFLPADLKITGDDIDEAAQDAYVAKVMDRAQIAGVETIVFGSGNSRRIPEGFSHEQAWEQLVDFSVRAARIAAGAGVILAIEPLRSAESNIVNTTGEGARLVREVKHPNFRLLVDSFHWGVGEESTRGIRFNGDLLHHLHIATVPGRLAPGEEDFDFQPFFETLKECAYSGRISIEGAFTKDPDVLRQALEIMQSLAD